MNTTNTADTLQTKWQIDAAHTQVDFEVKHLMFAKVRGRFTEVEGTVSTESEGEDQHIEANVTIKAASVDTGVTQRDDHLRSPDFFDVEVFPELTFRSLKMDSMSKELALVGELTIRDQTKSVRLTLEESGQVVDPWGNLRIGFSASTVIDRRDFGLTWNQVLEAGGLTVGNDVKIKIELQAVQITD